MLFGRRAAQQSATGLLGIAVSEQPPALVLKSLAFSKHDFEYREFRRGHGRSQRWDLLSPIRWLENYKSSAGFQIKAHREQAATAERVGGHKAPVKPRGWLGQKDQPGAVRGSPETGGTD